MSLSLNHMIEKYRGKNRCLSSKNAISASKSSTNHYWTLQEDELLAKIAKLLNYNWPQISLKMPSRSPEAIEAHWLKRFNKAQPSCWTSEEDEILKSLHKQLGANWKSISKSLPTHSQQDIKSHFYSLRSKCSSSSFFLGAAHPAAL